MAFSGPIEEKIFHTEFSPYGDLTFVTSGNKRIRSFTSLLSQETVRELRQHDRIYDRVSFFKAQFRRMDQDASFGTNLYNAPTPADLSRTSFYIQRFVLVPDAEKFIDCDKESPTSQYHSVCTAPSGPFSEEDKKKYYLPTGAKGMHYANVQLENLSAEFATAAGSETPVVNIYHSNPFGIPVAHLEFRSEDKALFAVTPNDERYLMGTFDSSVQIKNAMTSVRVLRKDQTGTPISGFTVLMHTDDSDKPNPEDHNIDRGGSNLFVWYRQPYVPGTEEYKTILDAASADYFCQYSRCEPKPVL